MDEARATALRERLVRGWEGVRLIRDARVLEAMRRIPRHRFVPSALEEHAYDDAPLPIGEGQTISQPYIVARMLEALRLEGGERALDVGTGSGYAAAVLGRLADEVHTIERFESLAKTAALRLEALGISNVRVHVGDGSLGLPEAGPFDAIVVAAAAPTVPTALVEQLADGGRLVIPLGQELDQVLVRLKKKGGEVLQESLDAVRFVPLIGEQGW
jgi:protein-L-isoaspartate(D-aspartate) O-methyltransferase